MVMVLMLNLLIAIISDTFERVVERQNAQFWKQLASLILDTEQLFGWAVNRIFPKEQHLWLHVLEPVNATELADESWSGRVRQLKLHMENSEKKVKAQVDDVKTKVDDVKAQLSAKVDNVNAKVDNVNAKVDEILKLLPKQQCDGLIQLGNVHQIMYHMYQGQAAWGCYADGMCHVPCALAVGLPSAVAKTSKPPQSQYPT
jgi:hypothetical protein